jgi:cytochrome P450
VSTQQTAATSGMAQSPVFDPFADNYLQDPYEFFGPLREQFPAFYSEKLGYWVIARHGDVKECFRDQERFSAAIALTQLKPLTQPSLDKLIAAGVIPGPTLVNEEPPDHAERRKRLIVAFTPQKMRALEPKIRQLCQEYVDRFVKVGHADLVADLTWQIPALAIFNFTGVPDDEVETCKRYSTSYALFNWGFPPDAEQLRLSTIMSEYWGYAKMHVDRLSRKLGDDFISELIRAHHENPGLFDESYVVRMMLNFTFAGHETTTAASANMFRALLENRDQWDGVCADPSLIPNAVEECLRFSTSVIAWRRETKVAVDVGGVNIPAGEKLLILSGSANRDHAEFEHGDELDIRRKGANRHLGFGFGAHPCMGAPLARLEMQIMLEEISRRLPHMKLIADQTWSYSPNTSFRGPKNLLVEWDPKRNPRPEDRPN